MCPFRRKKITEGSLFIEKIKEVEEEVYILAGIFGNLAKEFEQLLKSYEVQFSANTVKVFTGFRRRAKAISNMLLDNTFKIYSAVTEGEELIIKILKWKEKNRSTTDYPEKISKGLDGAERAIAVIRMGLVGINRKEITIEKLRSYLRNL